MVGFSRELLDQIDRLTVPEIREFAAIVAEESDEVANIVDDLLVATRAESGDLNVFPGPKDLRAQVERVYDAQRDCEDDLVVTTEDEVTAFADEARVRQILRNLLSNARRFGGDRIEVGITRHDDEIVLTVADSGPGIPEPDRERVFQPFQRAHTTPGVPASVGLGLTVSRQLARAMGGDLRYRNNGTSFFELSLPPTEESVSV